MRIVSTLALGLALAAAGVATPAFAKDKPAGPAAKYTPAVANGYNAAKKAIDAGDFATATTQYQTLKGQAQTDDDKLILGQLAVNIGQASKNQALVLEGVDLMIASNKAPAESLPTLYFVRGQNAYMNKDYKAAEAAFAQAQQAGSKDPQLIPLIVSSMQFNGETLQALTMLNGAIDKANAAGQPVPAEWYQRGFSIGYQTKPTVADYNAIRDQTTEITRKWITAYPTKSNWHDASLIYMSQYKAPTDVQVDVLRLLRAAGALSGDAEYREYAEDVYQRYPNEALSVLNEGSSKGIVNLTGKNDATEVLNIVKNKVAADKASLAGSDKAARSAADGKVALATADAYVSYQMYPQAVELYKLALSKGGVDASTVHLRMGWALASSGDAAGAKAEFAQVTGTRKPIADMWVVHLDHPTQG